VIFLPPLKTQMYIKPNGLTDAASKPASKSSIDGWTDDGWRYGWLAGWMGRQGE
jgi:hypothetical protein